MGDTIESLRAEVERLTAERDAANTAIRRQAAAVRMASSARERMDAHDRATLQSLAGKDRAAMIEELAAARRERDDWNAAATALESERDALRAIVAGRTTAPTDAETAAHDAAGGRWLVAMQPLTSGFVSREVVRMRGVNFLCGAAARWWPLDATGRPCAWPVVGAEVSR